VVDTAETFRAALDDFLTEEEATTGELNLLVDAVRLGAVNRLLSMLDHGADPVGAVSEAGDAFARDRGTDDLARCRWAVAVVGFALDRVDEGVVLASGVPGFSAAAPPSSPPAPAVPSIVPPARTFPETEAGPSVPAPPSPPPSVPAPPGRPPAWPPTPPPSPLPPPRRRRGRTVGIGLLVAAVVAAAVVVGIWLGSRGEDPVASDDPGSDASSGDEPSGGSDTGGDGGSAESAAAIPTNSIVVPVTDANGDSRIYAVDADSGDAEPLTDGPDDRNPAISPDRSTMIYLEATSGGSTRPIVMDVETRETRPLFRDDGVCDFAARPAFNPDGKRLAVLCLDEFGGYSGTAIVNLRGVYEAGLPVSGEPNGSPTWTSGSTLVYVQASFPEDQPTTLWETEVNGTTPVQLTDGSEGWDTHPDWSDDAGESGLLLFSRHQDEKPFGDLMTGDSEAQPGPATSGELWGHPAWSPDGTRVVFTERDSDGTERLAVASLEGDGFSDPQYVDDLPGEPGVPAWGTR